MKRLLRITILLLFCLIIPACKSEYKYEVVEITSHDLLANINENKSFVFAFVNSKNNNYDAFMNDLKTFSEKNHSKIYYVDYNHMDYKTFAYFVDNIDLTYNKCSYYVYKNKAYVVQSEYTNYQNLYKDLKNYTLLDNLNLSSEDELKEYYNKAVTEYNNGNIGIANDNLNLAWTLDEAKEFYKNNEYFKLIQLWENYEFRDPKKLDYTTYHSLFFSNHTNYYVEAIKSGDYATFVKPNTIDEHEFIYYYIKDDIIYTAEKDNIDHDKYKATYRLIDVSDDLMHLIDLKNDKEYEYIRGV